MAKSFDELVKRTTTKKTREKAARRTQELLAELLLSEVRELTGKSQRQVADAPLFPERQAAQRRGEPGCREQAGPWPARDEQTENLPVDERQHVDGGQGEDNVPRVGKAWLFRG